MQGGYAIALQESKKQPQQHEGLLEQQQRTELLHPLLEYTFRTNAYPNEAQMTAVIYKYAGVRSLTEFKRQFAPEFRGRSLALPKVLKELMTKVTSLLNLLSWS